MSYVGRHVGWRKVWVVNVPCYTRTLPPLPPAPPHSVLHLPPKSILRSAITDGDGGCHQAGDEVEQRKLWPGLKHSKVTKDEEMEVEESVVQNTEVLEVREAIPLRNVAQI